VTGADGVSVLDPRAIVRLAASRAKTGLVRKWLEWDEAGTWEKHAREMVAKGEEKRRELGVSDEAFASDVADYLRFLANTAAIAQLKAAPKGRGSRRSR